MNMYGFYTGEILDAYKYLGCHLRKETATFRVFAPNAERVSVMGDFCNWKEIALKKIYDGNFWEVFVPNAKAGQMYKYRIYKKDGSFTDHSDPYGFGMELPPNFASVIRDLQGYVWKDDKWIKNRTDCKNEPLNIYEIHFGSWRKQSDNTCYSYKELAKPLIEYVKEKGYNYIEIMPIAEYPCDNSWGYQQTGFYSPTSRYGNPDELRYFIDYAHQNNVGVILDFVPVHFAVDGYALAKFDGTALYEYPHADVGNSEWGSKNFNHSRGEVQSFLQSCACYWLKEFHFDGLRIDALSNILYWQGNKDRGVNENAVAFIKHMNFSLKKMDKSIMLIAEDSSAFEGVTKAVSEGGLGFDYKWDMGWMNDTLEYFKLHPYDRKAAYHKLTFSMMYFGNEKFLLPFSHDEVVHGKATIIQKMNGQYEEKFPQARALYLYMYTHPGKKLNFMGNEIAQFREWDEKREQDWDIIKYPVHDSFARYMKDLNFAYQNNPALYESDYEKDGFIWVDCHQEEKCVYVYERSCKKQRVLVLLNFSDKKQEYELNRSDIKRLKLILASDNQIYGGDNKYKQEKVVKRTKGKLNIEIGAFTGIMFEILE